MRAQGQDDHGKIHQAIWLTETFPEELEVDFQRYYGTDILKLGSGLSWRRMLTLVDYLPPESALMTAIRNAISDEELAARESNAENAQWSSTDSLLALLVDEIRNLTWVYLQSHSEAKVPRPDPILRPGIGKQPARKRRVLTADEARRLDPRLRAVPDDKIQQTMNAMTGRG